jgi:23S rRNA pseudouridine2605 synthase
MLERLNKLIAQAGIASRRGAEELIRNGEVSVNGEIITELGTKADAETDHIKVRGKLINLKIAKRENVYILLNKPKGYLSSAADPEGRKLVTDLVKGFGKVHPVGRLDYNTEGLIILTNDGDFTNKVASSKTVAKVYEVKVKGLPNENAVNKLRRGIRLEDGFNTAPAEIKELKHTENNGWYEVTLREGHNQQIRKMFDAVGHSVVKLKRVAIGHVKDDRIPVGAYRELDEDEINEFINPSKISVKNTGSKPAMPQPNRKINPSNNKSKNLPPRKPKR